MPSSRPRLRAAFRLEAVALLLAFGVPRLALAQEPGPASNASRPVISVRSGAPLPPSPEPARAEPEIVEGPPEHLSGYGQQRVPIVLVPPDSSVTVEIRSLTEPAARAACSHSCVADVEPGAYQLTLVRGGERVGSRKLELTQPERVTLRPPDESARTKGLVLGIAGAALFSAGVVMTAFAYGEALHECSEGTCKDQPGWLGPVGFSALVAGAIAAPIGWTMFARNVRPAVERTPLHPVTLERSAKQNGPAVTARIAPLANGAFVAGGLRF